MATDENDDQEAAEAEKTFVPVETSPDEAQPAAPARSEPQKIVQLGDFKIVKKLGSGGMGDVYLAHQLSLDRQVALKVMKKQFSTQKNFAERFIREARTMAKLEHPHTVRGYAVGQEHGLLYLAMELVKGRSAQDWMKQLKAMPVGDAVLVTLLIADALRHAHKELGLIHRDIKPDNILITEKGIVKLSDMGLAKAADDMSMTQSGTGLGTPYFMPPEQFGDAKHVDLRSDIYALGATLYYLITGKLPFPGASALEIMKAKTLGTFPRARSLQPAVPERLDLVLDKMMAKDPKGRYQTYDGVINDLTKLNVAHESLSFIETAERSVLSVVARTAANPPKPPPLRMKSGETSAAGGETAAGSRAAAPAAASDWLVVRPGPDGNTRTIKMNADHIRQMLANGAFDPKTKARPASGSAELRPLAGWPEFGRFIDSLQQTKKQEKTKEQLQKLYQSADRYERWHKWKRFFARSFSDLAGFLSLIAYLAVICGGLFALYYFWPKIKGLIGMP